MNGTFLIVPDHVCEAINRAIDKALESVPDAAKDRVYFYRELLAYYSEHGVIPEFTITKTTTPNQKDKP